MNPSMSDTYCSYMTSSLYTGYGLPLETKTYVHAQNIKTGWMSDTDISATLSTMFKPGTIVEFCVDAGHPEPLGSSGNEKGWGADHQGQHELHLEILDGGNNIVTSKVVLPELDPSRHSPCTAFRILSPRVQVRWAVPLPFASGSVASLVWISTMSRFPFWTSKRRRVLRELMTPWSISFELFHNSGFPSGWEDTPGVSSFGEGVSSPNGNGVLAYSINKADTGVRSKVKPPSHSVEQITRVHIAPGSELFFSCDVTYVRGRQDQDTDQLQTSTVCLTKTDDSGITTDMACSGPTDIPVEGMITPEITTTTDASISNELLGVRLSITGTAGAPVRGAYGIIDNCTLHMVPDPNCS